MTICEIHAQLAARGEVMTYEQAIQAALARDKALTLSTGLNASQRAVERIRNRQEAKARKASRYRVGDRITDRDGYTGTIREVHHFKGSTWYDVRFLGGEAVRYDTEIRLADQ